MLTGFTIVQPRTGPAEARLPARIYTVNGERRRFELLRDAGDDGQDISVPVDRIRRALLGTWNNGGQKEPPRTRGGTTGRTGFDRYSAVTRKGGVRLRRTADKKGASMEAK